MDGACSKVNDGQSDRIMQNTFVSVVSARQAFSEIFFKFWNRLSKLSLINYYLVDFPWHQCVESTAIVSQMSALLGFHNNNTFIVHIRRDI